MEDQEVILEGVAEATSPEVVEAAPEVSEAVAEEIPADPADANICEGCE